VSAAIDALPESARATSTIRQDLSSAAAAVGCSQSWSDMIHVNSTLPGGRRLAASGGDPFPVAAPVRACEYEVGPTEFGQQKPGGEFTAGRVVTGADRRHLGELLGGAPAADGCTVEATRFAVLTTPGRTDPVVYVELDGCRRLLIDTVGVDGRERTRLAQSPAALLGALQLH